MGAVCGKPIRAQYFLNGPISEPDMGHVTFLTVMVFFESGTEFGSEPARSAGPEMTS